ncbi:MAG: hypothetical protein D6721_02215 [Gammaproteobacteria bacterium]|nr:MAG: hypothetical protein D6721_02215 [Gammaproteobacteria bacterium]
MPIRTPRPHRLAPLGAALLLACSGSVPAADTITEALAGGKPSLDMRLRYENVDQTGISKNAHAFTLRTRLGYGTGTYLGVSAFAEFEDTTAVSDDDYNSKKNGKTQYPVVADPDATAVNQAYLQYTGLPDTRIRYGLQRVILDNARFVGNVGWRQNEQTFQGFTLVNTSLPDTTIVYGYVTEVHDILENHIDTRSHIVHLDYAGLPVGKLTAYGYFLDLRNQNSNKTLGLRFTGKQDLDAFTLLYALEYAKQSDYKGGNNAIDGDYRLIEVGGKARGITAKLGYEVLGHDNYAGFQTPLATKHAFNGWADKFLTTPKSGLEDVYLSVGGKLAGIKLLAVYHDFSSDQGSTDYGTEWNLLAAKKFGKHYSVGVKFADYNADKFATDTTKFWIWAGLKF